MNFIRITQEFHMKKVEVEKFSHVQTGLRTPVCLFYLSLEARVSTSLVIAGTCRCNGDEFHLQRAKKNWASTVTAIPLSSTYLSPKEPGRIESPIYITLMAPILQHLNS